LAVVASGSDAVVYPYKLKVGAHGPNRDVRIIWSLNGENARFDKSKGDGPVQLLSDSRFLNASPSNDPDGATQDPEGKYFRIDFKNDASTGLAGIPYDLQFTGKTGTVSCDPTISNESG